MFYSGLMLIILHAIFFLLRCTLIQGPSFQEGSDHNVDHAYFTRRGIDILTAKTKWIGANWFLNKLVSSVSSSIWYGCWLWFVTKMATISRRQLLEIVHAANLIQEIEAACKLCMNYVSDVYSVNQSAFTEGLFSRTCSQLKDFLNVRVKKRSSRNWLWDYSTLNQKSASFMPHLKTIINAYFEEPKYLFILWFFAQ